MNNKNTLIIIFLLVLGLIGTTFLIKDLDSEEVIPADLANESTEVVQKETEEYIEISAKVEMPEKAETAIDFDNFSGTVEYLAQKRFFSTADAIVTGTAEDIQGSGWFDPESGTFYVTAGLDFTDLSTDQTKRDGDVLELFVETEINIMAAAENDERILLDEEVTIDIPVMLTINGVTRSEIFEVTVTVTSEDFAAVGSAEIVLSNYDIITPTLIEVFSVDDKIEVTFDVSGDATGAGNMENQDDDQ